MSFAEGDYPAMASYRTGGKVQGTNVYLYICNAQKCLFPQGPKAVKKVDQSQEIKAWYLNLLPLESPESSAINSESFISQAIRHLRIKYQETGLHI